MPRKRTIAPGFFKNEDLGACSPLARLLFAGMWCWADREGRLEDRPRRIKAEILPYDDGVDGEQLVAELATHGFLDRYEVNGQRFIQILHFDTYQDPHPNETKSVIPARNGGGEPLVLPRSTKDQPPEDQGEPKEASSKARPSCPSRPSQPSRDRKSVV